jgi:hypothetical protein
MPAVLQLRPLALVTALILAGCGGDSAKEEPDTEAETEAAAATEQPPAAASTPTAGSTSAPITVDDIDRWEKGMAGELAVVRESGEKLKSARNGEDTLAAMMGVQEMTTTPAGARAAGMDEERYKTVRSNLSAAVAYLTPHLGGIDTTMLSAAQRDEMRQMNAAQLKQLEGTVPPEVIEALKPNADALKKKELELAGARLKGAGM